jgi:hypothetical protein
VPFGFSECGIHWGQQPLAEGQWWLNTLRTQGSLPELRISGTPKHPPLAGSARKRRVLLFRLRSKNHPGPLA